MKGYLDKVALDQVNKYETGLLAELRGKGKDILAAIRKEQQLTSEIEGKLKDLLETYSKTFA